MKYNFPIQLRRGLDLTLTQGFRSDTQLDLSTALSTTTRFHNGVDIVCGTNEQTWGQSCVWPFPWDGIVYASQVDSLFGATKNARAQIDTTDPMTGIKYSLIYLHLSSVTNTKTAFEDKIVIYKEGDVIGKIGNNGFVKPPPTAQQPLMGSHLHLGLGVKKPDEINYTMVDPQLHFEVNRPFRPSVRAFVFNKNLWIGMNNSDVKELQKRIGMIASYQTGYFGAITFTAVRAYQASKRITTTGFVGQLTRAALNN